MANQTHIYLTADSRSDVDLTIDSLLTFLPAEGFRLDITRPQQSPDGKWVAFGALHIDIDGALKTMDADKAIAP